MPQPVSGEENAAPVAIETERPRSFSSQNLNVEEIDTESNPQLVAVYVKDIYRYLHELEVVLNFTLLKFSFTLTNESNHVGKIGHQA